MGYLSKYSITTLVGEENEIIPTIEWDLSAMAKGDFAQMVHPHVLKMEQYIYDNFKTDKEVIYVSNCSAQKPYEKSRSIGGMYKYMEKFIPTNKFDRAVISDVGVIPFDNVPGKSFKFNHLYPYSHYAFDNDVPNPDDKITFINMLEEKLYRFFKQYPNYKHVVALFKIGSKAMAALQITIQKLKDEGREIRFYQLPSKETFDSFNGLESTAYQVTNMKTKCEVVTVIEKLLKGEIVPETKHYTKEEATAIRKKLFQKKGEIK